MQSLKISFSHAKSLQRLVYSRALLRIFQPKERESRPVEPCCGALRSNALDAEVSRSMAGNRLGQMFTNDAAAGLSI